MQKANNALAMVSFMHLGLHSDLGRSLKTVSSCTHIEVMENQRQVHVFVIRKKFIRK